MGSVCSSVDYTLEQQAGSEGEGTARKLSARITPKNSGSAVSVRLSPETNNDYLLHHNDNEGSRILKDGETGERDTDTGNMAIDESGEPGRLLEEPEDKSKATENKFSVMISNDGDKRNKDSALDSVVADVNLDSGGRLGSIIQDDLDSDSDSGLDGEDCFHDHEPADPSVVEAGIQNGGGKMGSFGELAITKPAPEFECNAVVNGSFQTVKLSSFRGRYVVLFFYPLDFTFVCPTEIIAFSDRAEEFRAINCEVLACSTDSVYSHLAWIDTPRKQGGLGPMKIPLLADRTQEISKKYGCLKPDEGIAFRGLYIIDDKGNLRQITINDLPVGRSVDETLRLVQAFQFTDKHGEVCPAGWKPGKETMKPDPKESQKYFNQMK